MRVKHQIKASVCHFFPPCVPFRTPPPSDNRSRRVTGFFPASSRALQPTNLADCQKSALRALVGPGARLPATGTGFSRNPRRGGGGVQVPKRGGARGGLPGAAELRERSSTPTTFGYADGLREARFLVDRVSSVQAGERETPSLRGIRGREPSCSVD